MDKETLSNYGWIVICVLVLSVMIALATPFGTFISNAVQNTTEGLFKTEQSALEKGLKASGIKLEDATFGTLAGNNPSCTHTNMTTYTDDKKCDDCGYVEYGTSIHKGLMSVGATLEAVVQICGNCGATIHGDIYCSDCQEFTNATNLNLKEGDVLPLYICASNPATYTFGDYYCYSEGMGGWDISVIDKTKSEYNSFYESELFGIPVYNISFANCVNLKEAPLLPQGIPYLCNTFENCTSLEKAEINNNVDILQNTFLGCTNLEEVVFTNLGDCSILSAFDGCTSLKKIDGLKGAFVVSSLSSSPLEEISNCDLRTYYNDGIELQQRGGIFQGITTLKTVKNTKLDGHCTFKNCTNLVTLENVTFDEYSNYAMVETFAGCTSLKNTNNVTYGYFLSWDKTFAGCTLLEKAPDEFVSTGYLSLYGVFKDCVNLTGDIKLEGAPLIVDDECFAGTLKPIHLIGDDSICSEIVSASTNGNITYN